MMPTQIQTRQLKAIAEADEALNKLELKQIERTNNALEKALADLIKQLRGKLSDDNSPNLFAQQRAILIANDLRDTLNVFSPDNARTKALLEDFKQLTIDTDRVGSELAKTLVEHYEPSIASTADLSLDVVAAVAQAGYDRLLTRGSAFADNASTAIQQGLLQGWGVSKITSAVKAVGGVTRFEAERLVRTESTSAAISAVKNRYQAEGINQAIWIATQDRKVCPRCAARAGGIYQIDKITCPLHPFDRCYLSPYKQSWADAGLIDLEWMQNHHEETVKLAGKADNSPSPWETGGKPKRIIYKPPSEAIPLAEVKPKTETRPKAEPKPKAEQKVNKIEPLIDIPVKVTTADVTKKIENSSLGKMDKSSELSFLKKLDLSKDSHQASAKAILEYLEVETNKTKIIKKVDVSGTHSSYDRTRELFRYANRAELDNDDIKDAGDSLRQGLRGHLGSEVNLANTLLGYDVFKKLNQSEKKLFAAEIDVKNELITKDPRLVNHPMIKEIEKIKEGL